MKRAKHSMGFSGKSLTLIISLVALCAVAVGGTLAWLFDSSEKLENNFYVPDAKIDIEETFDGREKTDVGVTNTGEAEVYVRVMLVETWRNSDDQVVAEPEGAVVNYEMGNSNDWVKGSDGYYYYTKPLDVGDTTPNLIDKATCTVPKGAALMDLEVVAQGIQSMPEDAVEEAWGVVTVGADGNLVIG